MRPNWTKLESLVKNIAQLQLFHKKRLGDFSMKTYVVDTHYKSHGENIFTSWKTYFTGTH